MSLAGQALTRMRVLIVDDHELVRRGVRAFLGSHSNWEVCGEAVNGADAVAKARELNPDIVVMDISMPEMNGLEATRQLRSALPSVEVLILSQHESAEMARQALQAGARGYVVKGSVGRDLLTALQKVSRRELFFDPVVLGETAGRSGIDVQEIESRSAILEQALRENEELYRSTFELSPVGIAHLDRDGNFIRVNAKLAEILEYSPQELLALNYQHVTHPADLAAEIEQVSHLLHGESEEGSTERRYITKNGRSVWVMRTASIVRDKSKRLKHLIFIVEDITERKEAEETKFRLAAIVDSSDDAIVSKDLNGTIRSWNTAAERIFGYTAKEAVGQHITLIIPPELREEETGILKKLRAGEQIEHFETTRVRKDGRKIQVSLTISPVRDARGRVIGASKIARDVTGRRESELARLRLASIVESSHDAIVSKDLNGIIMSWNQGAERIFGFTEEEAMGKPITIIIPAELQAEESEILERIRTGERIEHVETVRARKDGTRLEVSLTISPLKNSQGKIIGASKIARDISERKRFEAALQESEQHLRLAQAAAQIGTWEWDPVNSSASLSMDLHRFFGTDASDPEHQKKWVERIYPEDSEKVQKHLTDSASSGEVEFEYRYQHPSDGLRWFYCKGRRFSEKSSRMFGIVMDVTDRRRAAAALRQGEERLRAAFTQNYAFTALLDLDGTILEVNQAALDVISATRSQVLGKKFWEPWWGSFRNEVEIAQTNVRRARQGEVVRDQCQYHLADGNIRFAERTVSPVKDEQGNIVLLVASGIDMTEQMQLRESLEERVRTRTAALEKKNTEAQHQAELVRELSARLLQSQDDERRRIARELHDSAGQILTALQMNLASVEPHSSTLPVDAGRALRDSIDLVGQLVQEIRTLSYLLHPPLLDEAGLPSALDWYVQGFSTRSKIAADVMVSPDLGRLPRDLETTIFRIVQECLTNIHRHSGSPSAHIRIDRDRQQVRIEVRDRGKGMSSGNGASRRAKAGVGLRGMQERVHQFGGSLTVQSDTSGTAIIAVLPLTNVPSSAGEKLETTPA